MDTIKRRLDIEKSELKDYNKRNYQNRNTGRKKLEKKNQNRSLVSCGASLNTPIKYLTAVPKEGKGEREKNNTKKMWQKIFLKSMKTINPQIQA